MKQIHDSFCVSGAELSGFATTSHSIS